MFKNFSSWITAKELLEADSKAKQIYNQWLTDKEQEKKDAEKIAATNKDLDEPREIDHPWKGKTLNLPDWAKEPHTSSLLKKHDFNTGTDDVASALKSVGTDTAATSATQSGKEKHPAGSHNSELKIANVAYRFASLIHKIARPIDNTGKPIKTDQKIIRNNLKKAIAQFAGEIGSPLPPSPMQFAKYTKWLERVTTDDEDVAERQAKEILKKLGHDLLKQTA